MTSASQSLLLRHRPALNRQFSRLPVYLGLTIVAVMVLYPFVFMLSTALRESTILRFSPWDLVPSDVTLANFHRLFSNTSMLNWLGNSMFVATATAVLKVGIDSLAGYAFARLQFKFKELIFLLLIGAMMVPPAVTIVPRFLLLRDIGLINTPWALILPHLSYPLGVFLMRQAMAAVPYELEEAAKLDGCSVFTIYWRIVLPLVAPALAVVAITTFMYQWVDLLWPVVAITSDGLKTVTVGISSMKAEQSRADWGLIMAANTCAMIPIGMLFVFCQRYFMTGMTSGSLK